MRNTQSSDATMTESERKKMSEEDLQKRLDSAVDDLISRACIDQEFAKKLCEKVSRLSRNNRELRDIIEKHSIGTSGRYARDPKVLKSVLLYHYAHYFSESELESYGERSEEAMNRLIRYYDEVWHREISLEAMRNKLGKAISSEDIKKYPDWVQDAIKERKKRRIPPAKT